MIDYIVLLSIPGLRPSDVHDPRVTPTLYRLMHAGGWRPLVPTFPCVTSPVQASMLTGVGPGEHGVIANGFYHADRSEVAFWTGHHDVIERPTFFNTFKRKGRKAKSAAFHLQNIKGADANYICTPSPIHEDDGTTKLWCYTKPPSFYQRMVKALGHFPLQHYWGPLSNIESSKWICEASLWLAKQRAPKFQHVYLPHLDYASQKHGPNSSEATRALSELDQVLDDYIARYDEMTGIDSTAWIIAGEYALTDVDHVVYPNRMLREAGLLKIEERSDGEHLNIAESDAFAMVDHQLAHVYVRDDDVQRVAEIFQDCEGVADLVVGRERAGIGMDHERSAPIILIARPDSWFAYYWWDEDAAAPAFARTVDIHAKPGYDPVELFFDPKTRSIPLDATLVKGSHGSPAVNTNQHTILMCTQQHWLDALPTPTRDIHIHQLLCRAFGIESG